MSRILCRLLVVLCLLPLGARAEGSPERAQTLPIEIDETRLGLHAREVFAHQGEPDAPWTRERATPGISTSLQLPRSSAAKVLQQRVYGYLPYFSSIDAATFRWETVSDLVLFSADLTKTGTVSSYHGFPQTAMIQAAHQHGVRCHLGVTLFNTSADSAVISGFLANASAESAAISTLVAKVKAAGIEGINLDFEFVPSASRAAYSAFVKQFADALHAELPSAELTLAVPPGLGYKGYDPAALSSAADRLLIMFYDYYWGSAPNTGPVAPLTKGSFWGASVTTDLDTYLTVAPAAKLAMGVPYYGYDWAAASASRNAKTSSKGTAVLVKSAIPNGAQRGRIWDADSQTPWYTYVDSSGARRQAWYDDDQSLALKFRTAKTKVIAGAMIWALGYDTGQPQVADALMNELGAEPAPVDAGTPDSGVPPVGPSLTITEASFAPAELKAGEIVTATIKVKNTGDQSLIAAAPPPDTLYDESQSATGAINGTFRVALDADGRDANLPALPWRWGLDAPLAAGAEVTLTARVRLNHAGLRNLWAAVVEEGTGTLQDNVSVTPIQVDGPDAGTSTDGGTASNGDGGRDPGPPDGTTTVAAQSSGCSSAAPGALALLVLILFALSRQKSRRA
ncbi:MAG: hypothetical protein JST92_14615 [Deltaproteobacteria bacterium]|nr:hypothetical protein [Deltaproteobacteria bacterium]